MRNEPHAKGAKDAKGKAWQAWRRCVDTFKEEEKEDQRLDQLELTAL